MSSAGFVEGSVLGVTRGYPCQEGPPPCIFWNSIGDEGEWPSGVWHRKRVANVPDDTKAVFLVGLLVITNPTAAAPRGETADLHVYFRAPGARATPPQDIIDYPGQTCIAGYGGQRSGCSVWVPLINREFEWWWYRSTPPGYPQRSAYGGKFYVNAYLR